jgi:hypothetical protein
VTNGSNAILRHGVKKARRNEFEHESRQSLGLSFPPSSLPRYSTDLLAFSIPRQFRGPGPGVLLLKKYGCSPDHSEIRMGVE